LNNNLNILLSAYACEPGKGSEPGVGWHWAVELARAGHHVTIITRSNNREGIERALLTEPAASHLDFHYCDLPAWARRWKKGGRGVHLYYLLWQAFAYGVGRRLVRTRHFDLVQHITFVSARQPSFMGLLGVPFVFGPVSGGETAPMKLRGVMPPADRRRERLRDLINWAVRFDPLLHLTFASAKRILVTSASTRELVPRLYRRKVDIRFAIGIDAPARPATRTASATFKVLYAGRLVGLKGLPLAIEAFARFHKEVPDSSFTIVGSGPMLQQLTDLERSLGTGDSVVHIPEIAQDALLAMYADFDVLLFPSLRESGGMVVLEAMACGTPVVCLDQNGPGTLVDHTCGKAVRAGSTTRAEVVDQLAAALHDLATDPSLRRKLSEGARVRAHEHSWPGVVGNVYQSLADLLVNRPEDSAKELAGVR
jgi:glycosyltransferase involved in cell wall biosynthesis